MGDMSAYRIPPRDLALVLVICTVWAGNFIAGANGMQHFSPFLFMIFRFALETSADRERARNMIVKCRPPINRHTLSRRSRCPGGGRRMKGNTTSRTSANRK
ncbi:hypothetical protein ACFL07_11830, partial [Pseudomonadota bacterium]